jgi:hypothetical protein
MPRKKEGQKLIEEAQNLYTQKKYSEALAKLREARNLPAWNLYSDTWHDIEEDLRTQIELGQGGDAEHVVLAESVLLAEPVPVDKYEERDDAERRFGHGSDPEPEPEPEYVGGPRPDLLGWENATHAPGAPPVYQNKKPKKPKKPKPKKPKKGPGCCSRPQKEKRTKKKGTKRKSKKRTKKKKI